MNNNIVETEITANDNELFYGVWEIYNSSFPESERRSLINMRYVTQLDECHLLVYTEMDKIIGFIMYWEYPQFVYLEYLAVNPEVRSGGLGAKIINSFVEKFSEKPIILEIDEMVDEISKRRCGFYQRNGFILNEHIVHRPTDYSDLSSVLNLHIMSSQKPISHELYNHFNEILQGEIMDNLYREETK